MVQKIAVIALVAIVACPILIGYAFALEETTKTGYQEGDYVNVTPLIKNSTAYDFAAADIYSINADNFYDVFSASSPHFYPNYISNTTAVTPIVKRYAALTPGAMPVTLTLADYHYIEFYIGGDNYSSSGYCRLRTYDSGGTLMDSILCITYFTYDENEQTLKCAYQTNPDDPNSTTYINLFGVAAVYIQALGTGSWDLYGWWDSISWNNEYRSQHGYFVDVAAGYNRNVDGGADNMVAKYWRASNSNYIENFLCTFDLGSETGTTFELDVYTGNPDNSLDTSDPDMNGVRGLKLEKIGGEWCLMSQSTPSVVVDTLIYDPASSDNVYQVKINRTGLELYYVGHWPSLIAKANYYRVWTQDYDNPIPDNFSIGAVGLDFGLNTTFRFDESTYRGFTYQVTQDYTYTPSKISGNNVVSSISSVSRTGSSIQFGGYSYPTSKGNIQIGSHKVPLTSVKFESSWNGDGTYSNKINGDLISTTPTPSNIIFDGVWVMDLSSAPLTQYTYTETEWKAGEFAWDGMDQNFLMVGLLTSIGAFVALGVYARKRGSGGLIPLIIVVGCAAFLFFMML